MRFSARVSFWQKITLLFSGIFLFFVLLEIGLRAGGFVFSSLQEYKNSVSIKQKGAYRIMCLGESTSAWYNDNCYPAQLEKILNQRNIGIRFSVINKGVPGTTTSYILSRLEDNLNKYEPDMVITMMGINDGGGHAAYEEPPDSKIMLFFKSFRIYKLTKLLWLHIVTKAKETGFYKPKEDAPRLQADIPTTGPSMDYDTLPDSTQTEEAYKKATEINPLNDEAFIALGLFYSGNGDFMQAKEAYKKATEINPLNDEAFVKLGGSFFALGEYSRAEGSCKKAIEINPLNYSAYFMLGSFCRGIGKLVEAEEVFKRVLALSPEDKDEAYLSIGSCYMGQGKYTQAEEMFKKAIEINPQHEHSYGSLASLYQDMGKYKSAFEYQKKADSLRLNYYNPIARHNYQRLKVILDKRGIRLVCVQYPMRKLEPLRKLLEPAEGITFVDNEKAFKEAVKKAGYKEYFADLFGGDTGHCTPKGDRILAENVADAILKDWVRNN